MKNLIKRSTIAVAGGVLAATALSGCISSGGASANKTEGASSCSSSPSAANKAPTIAILGQTGAGISYYRQDIALVESSAIKSSSHVIVNGVGDPVTAPDLAADVVLTGDGPNPSLRSTNLACKQGLVNSALNTRLAKTSKTNQPDSFDALNVLSGNLKGHASTTPVDVLLFSSLVAKGGGVDLSNPKTLGNPKAAIDLLAKQGLIPSLKNVRLYAVHPARGLTDAQAAQLKEFWRLYALKSGAQLVTWTDHLTAFPIDGTITAADTSPIQIAVTPTTVTATLKGDVLFDAGSPALRPGAAGQLEQLLAQVDKYDGAVIITGYTDVGGDEAANKRLSLARAQGVGTWLTQQHVPSKRITASGAGSSYAVYTNPQTGDQHQANRRVIVQIATR